MILYNDNDPGACAWLRELMAERLIPEGVVDERSIADIQPTDLAGYHQCHFFCGIAGWPLALDLAGWPAGEPVWTGSCPCQPFSQAGKGQGGQDRRHLWPAFFRLVRECRPATVAGEQVSGAAGYDWLARVSADLESADYRVGAADLPAACVGAPHIRQRLFWVADTSDTQRRENRRGGAVRAGAQGQAAERPSRGGGDARRLDDTPGQRAGKPGTNQPGSNGPDNGVSGSAGAGTERLGDLPGDGRQQGSAGPPRTEPDSCGPGPRAFWADSIAIPCRDGKRRRIPAEPLLFPLAHGVPGRVGLLRGAGNAICPEVAALFLRAYLEAKGDLACPS